MAALFLRRVALGMGLACALAVALFGAVQAGFTVVDIPSLLLLLSLPAGMSLWVAAAAPILLVLLLSALSLLIFRPNKRRIEPSDVNKTATQTTVAVDQPVPVASIPPTPEASSLIDPNPSAGEPSGLPELPEPVEPEPPQDLPSQPTAAAATVATATVDGRAGQAAPAGEVPSIPLENRTEVAGSLVKMGQQAAMEGNRERAHGLMRQALEVDSLNVDAWVWRGATAGSPEESLVCLRTALILDPENERAKRGLASLLSQSLEGTAER